LNVDAGEYRTFALLALKTKAPLLDARSSITMIVPLALALSKCFFQSTAFGRGLGRVAGTDERDEYKNGYGIAGEVHECVPLTPREGLHNPGSSLLARSRSGSEYLNHEAS
jgi:hypothetical protein